ncbi:conserved Plasmodium protein, unknown function [Plasmodium malariae]|uniref:Uncharacterized protein n=1 Tax=Plasmodium malariae TaxID=5858 RepID=A0A1C3KDH5_PLAMA|nr:conserved Plasmodium protein, unknown function [Plasmodium malariae]
MVCFFHVKRITNEACIIEGDPFNQRGVNNKINGSNGANSETSKCTSNRTNNTSNVMNKTNVMMNDSFRFYDNIEKSANIDSKEESIKLLNFHLGKKCNDYVKLGDSKNEKTTNYQVNYVDNFNTEYSLLNEEHCVPYKNESQNFEEIYFENNKENIMFISNMLGYYHNDGKSMHIDNNNSNRNDTYSRRNEEYNNNSNDCYNNFGRKDLRVPDKTIDHASTIKDINLDHLHVNNYKNENKKKSYRTLRGSLKMDYIFKDSIDLAENNMGSSENYDYYYYNKFKSFNYGKNDNSYNVRELINNKINAEYYHLKLNILILSCIIIQIFNSFILILISNKFIRKKEKIFFFCFLYSLLESVTDVISDNIFFLCGKFTNIYKREFSLNSIYIIQVISKMILSLSTVFIYFVYHIFVLLHEHANIMIINTFIKTLSIFILSFIFLKNKNNIFNFYKNERFENVNCSKEDRRGITVINKTMENGTEKSFFKINMKNDEIDKHSNGEDYVRIPLYDEEKGINTIMNIQNSKERINNNCENSNEFNYYGGIYDNYRYNDKYCSDYFYSSIDVFCNEQLLKNDFVKNESNKKETYMDLLCDNLKHIAEFFNFFKLLSRIKCYIFKKNNINYNNRYTLLTVHGAQLDEQIKTNIFVTEKQDYKIRLSIMDNFKKLFNINDNINFYSRIKNSGITKYNSLIEKEIEYINKKEKKKKTDNKDDNGRLSNIHFLSRFNSIKSLNNKKKFILSYPIRLLLNNLNFSNIFYICLLLIIPTFERIFLNYKIKYITLDMHSYCYLNLVNYVTDLIGLYLYISYFSEESYATSIFLSSLVNIFLMSLRFLFFHYRFNQLWLLFLETILKSLHKTFFYMPIYILVTKVYIKNIHNLMCSFYSSILDASSFASHYFEYLILSYYSIDDSKSAFIFVYIIFLILHLLSLVIISRLKKT